MSKKVQKRHSGAKALLLETLFVYPFLMMSGCQNKVEIREILNIIIFKKDCGLLQWNYPCQIELNRKQVDNQNVSNTIHSYFLFFNFKIFDTRVDSQYPTSAILPSVQNFK